MPSRKVRIFLQRLKTSNCQYGKRNFTDGDVTGNGAGRMFCEACQTAWQERSVHRVEGDIEYETMSGEVKKISIKSGFVEVGKNKVSVCVEL